MSGQTLEKVKVYYSGTDVLWKKYYVNEAGVKHGEYRMYWRNGETKVKCFYVLGKLDGEYKEYYPSGSRWLLQTCKAGVLDGLYRQWYEGGQLEIETQYKNGEDVGPYREWAADGGLITDIPAGHASLKEEYVGEKE